MTRRTWLILAAALMLVAALGGLGSVASASFPNSPSASVAQSVAEQSKGEQPFDCAQISALGLEKQTNLRAYELLKQCGKAEAPQKASDNPASDAVAAINKILAPLAYGFADVNISFETTAYPKVTQSETFVWGNGNTVVATMNDSRNSPGCYGGGSVSLDGGVTWQRIGGAGPSPFCTGRGTNFGDPTVVFSTLHNKWFASFLATGCGGQGIGVWESPDGVTWTVSPTCAHSGTSDDRQSHWIDNNPASPYYGRQYISWNDFGAGQVIRVVWSDNGGVSWSAPVNLTTSFIRNVQITGDLQGSGTVYLAAMNEGGGGLNPRQNVMYRSTNGGTTWTNVNMGPTFYPPGRAVSGYFAGMYPGGYFRHMGWGQPAASGPNVHYVYSMGIQGSDPGNMMYQRSTDSGLTWSTPFQLNTDTTTRAQFMGNLAANAQGSLFTGWYDERETTTCTQGNATVPCYRRWGRASTDNGATWMADDMVGDVISPLPTQPDPNVQPLYAGDYDYSSANGTMFYQTWTDGRVPLNNNSQQDVFFDRIPLVQGTPTPTVTGTPPTATQTNTRTNTPTATATVCGGTANYSYTATAGATIVPGTTDTGNHCDDCVTSVTLPFPFRLYDQTYNSVSVSSNGNAQFVGSLTDYTNTCLPAAGFTYTIFPYWEDLRTDTGANCPAGGCGVFTSVSGTAPNRIFNIEWRAVLFSGGALANFQVRLYEGTTDSRFDVIYGANPGNTSATGGVQRDQTLFTQAFCNGAGQATTAGTMLAYRQPSCNTATPGSPVTNTATRTATTGATGVATATCPPSGGGGTPGPWRTSTAGPAPGTYRMGAASVGQYVYVYGGGTSTTTGSNGLHRWDSTTETWTQLANMPTAKQNIQGAHWNGRIYVPGGFTTGGHITENAIYDIATNTWSTGAPLPTTKSPATAAFNGRIYAFGGNPGPTTDTFIYDIAANTWSNGAAMPLPVTYGRAITMGNYIYYIGGIPNGTGSSAAIYRYDPVANSWTTMPTQLQTARSGHELMTDGTRIFIVNGATGTAYFDGLPQANTVEIYNPTANTISYGNPTVQTASSPGGGLANNKLMIYGGVNASVYYTLTQVSQLTGGGTAVPCPSGTVGATNTATRTGTAQVSPTVCPPGGGAWTTGPNFSATAVIRSVGVYFPANGRFYSMGGRTADPAGSDLTNVHEFNPANNTWTMLSGTYPDNEVNNMACGVLTDAGTPYIYCVGGSAAGATTATSRVFRFNPATGAITAVSAPWPGNTNGAILPGGFAVHNNKLYIIGGFEINVAMTNQTWEFTPGTNAWVQKANLPVARGYVPATTIGNMIYTAGGSDYTGGALVDTVDSFRYDPAANTWTPIANTPRATAETRAVTLNGEMWVLGGGRTSPNPSSMVEIYNPASNTWRAGPAFTTARRNFAADSNGTDRIWLVGGYAPSTPTNTMEIFVGSGNVCPTPGTPAVTNTATRTNTATVPVPPTTAVATNTATRTNTPVVPPSATNTGVVPPSMTMTSAPPTATRTTAPPTTTAMPTATVCTMNFTDVDTFNPFRIYIRCLYCAGVLGGYSTNPPCTTGTPCFRPYDNVTRGQIAKIVSNAAGFNEAPGNQIFVDVPPTHPFFTWINRLARRSILGGYNTTPPCPGAATPCFRPEAPATRGQMAKIVSNAAGYNDNPPAGTISFTDVPTTHPFYIWIERLARRGIISGYDCGGPGEPCDAARRPYYRPQNLITRGQTSKIVANAFFPSCQPPLPPATPPARPEERPEDVKPVERPADN